MTDEQRQKLMNLRPSDIDQVYSGIDGKCCCGCSGTHYYRAAYAADPTNDLGEVKVSDKMVVKVLSIIQAAEDVDFDSAYIATTVGKRLYIAYLRG